MKRRGFTLVELLVVIAIIGILVALLLPAIQAAREAGRRMSCGNNIKQLVLGMHNYHDVHNMLPIHYGTFNASIQAAQYNDTNTGKSWMVSVLPFIEQQNIYDQIHWIDPSDPAQPGRLVHPKNTEVAQRIIKTFLCASDGDNGRGAMTNRANVPGGTQFGINNYKANNGANWSDTSSGVPSRNWSLAGGQVVEDVQPAPSPGSGNGLDRGNGIICRNADGWYGNYHDLAFVTDGTANTFAVGEAVPRWCTHTWWWWFNGTTATCGVPLNYKTPSILGGTQTLEGQWGDWPNNYSFMSKHPNGAQFGMTDGAVKFIPDSIDFTTYKRLATAAGGRPAQLPQ